jgi:putative ABC transport system permease protein
MLFDFFQLALKNLKKRGLRSWLTILGIFIGIAAVVSLISLGQGLQTAITGQFASLSTDTLTVSSAETGFGPPGATAVKKLNKNDQELIERVPGVDIVIPRLIRIVKVEFNDIVQFRFIGSNPKEQDQINAMVNSLNIKIAEGRYLRTVDRGKIVLGDDFKSEDAFGKKIRLGTKLNIQGKEFEVIGFLERASTFTLNSVVIMPEEDMKKLLDIGDEIDLIVVKVENGDNIDLVANDIKRKMRRDRNQDTGEEDFSVQTPVQALGSVNTIINVIQVVIGGIAAISLLIGGIGIANTMFTSVLERTREIGVMKAIGAKNKDILSIFLFESALLGLVGGIVGAGIGLALAFASAQIANSLLNDTIFSVTPSLPLISFAILFSLLVGILAGIVPAIQASKLNPVEALRR